MTPRFEGKVCIVTGAGSGIGCATAVRLASEGGRVLVVDRDEAGGAETIDAARGEGAEAELVVADVARADDARRAVAHAVDTWGRVDVLVNNAAIMRFAPVRDLAESDWDAVVATTLTSVFLWSKACLPHIRGGAIVNVTSVHAQATTPDVAPYAAAKAGVEAFTRALSREHDPSVVRVNAVAPGAVDTPMLWSNPNVASGAEQVEQRVASPDEVATAIAFLASDDASYVNGTTLVVDGGRLAEL